MDETRSLVDWVHHTRLEDIPANVVEAAKIDILDDLASGFAAAHTTWTNAVADMAQEISAGSCSIFGRSWTSSASYAALVNGVSIGGFETDHPHTAASAHPSGAVFPSVLALAEQHHVGGRLFLEAVITGYEALCRVGVAATRAVEDERGFHGPGTNAAIGSALGSGKVLDLGTADILNAVGIAASHGGGILEFHREGAMTKRIHLGRGSQMGLESVLLAQRGFTGPSTALEGEHGFFHVYSPSPKPELLLKDIGKRWLMMDLQLKAYPCHISFHAVIEAVQKFRQEHSFTGEQVEAVKIVSADRMMQPRFGDRAPTTLMGAQYSMPWSVAYALSGDVRTPSVWANANLADPTVQRIAGQMELVNAPASATADVDVTVAGQTHHLVATDWKGASTNPPSFEDMGAKLQRYVDGQVSDAAIAELIERVGHLETETDVAAIARLIRSS